MPSIATHNVLVIGGTSGIGLALAHLLPPQGTTLTVASSNPDRVSSTVSSLQTAFPAAKIFGQVIDLSGTDVEDKLTKLFEAVVSETGRKLDHVVNTANSFKPIQLATSTYDTLLKTGHYTFIVPYLIAKLLPNYVTQSHTSSLTITTGRLGQRPIKGLSVISGSSSAVLGIGRGLALDLAPIRVNVVSPGIVDTPLIAGTGMRDAYIEHGAKESPLGKVGTAEEVAEAYLYLMRDTNTTGEVVNTNSGILIA
jgi:NAD(P)-dependent dehydrogenase (short-subunit alcohol dehydrogenase family)